MDSIISDQTEVIIIVMLTCEGLVLGMFARCCNIALAILWWKSTHECVANIDFNIDLNIEFIHVLVTGQHAARAQAARKNIRHVKTATVYMRVGTTSYSQWQPCLRCYFLGKQFMCWQVWNCFVQNQLERLLFQCSRDVASLVPHEQNDRTPHITTHVFRISYPVSDT